MKMKCLLLLGLLIISTGSYADDEPGRDNDDFDPERMARIDHIINDAIERGEIPGAVVLVSKGNDTDLLKAYGFADMASGKAMETDAIFRIASMTKAVTTVAAMVLYEQGYFSLKDPISKFLPEFSNMKVVSEVDDDGRIVATTEAKNPIRIIDLMSHTSGISYPFIASQVQIAYQEAGVIDGLTIRDMTLKSQMVLLARQPLLFEPGTQFAYGLSTDLLGYLIEVVSGQTLANFIADHITVPLEMADTHFYLPANQADRLATLYAHVESEGLVVSDGTESTIKLDNPNYPIEGAQTYYCGGAGLSSTAQDYTRFMLMLLNDGELDGVRVLSRKSVELMRSARTDWDDDSLADFGLGFQVTSDLGKAGEIGSIGTYSWAGAFYTSFWIDPSENLVAVFMSQVRPADSDVADKFRTLVYQALK